MWNVRDGRRRGRRSASQPHQRQPYSRSSANGEHSPQGRNPAKEGNKGEKRNGENAHGNLGDHPHPQGDEEQMLDGRLAKMFQETLPAVDAIGRGAKRPALQLR